MIIDQHYNNLITISTMLDDIIITRPTPRVPFTKLIRVKKKKKMFRYGEIATPAMALLAENGDTKKLEIDMKSSSHNIRSVIKARFSYIWVFNKKLQSYIVNLDSSWCWCISVRSLKFLDLHPSFVSPMRKIIGNPCSWLCVVRGLQQRSNVVGRTFAVFRMDATKHLLSLISKIIPR